MGLLRRKLDLKRNENVAYAGHKKRSKKVNVVNDTILQFICITLFFIWMELIYIIFGYQEIGVNFIYPILFCMGIGGIITLITGFFTPRFNRVIVWFVMIVAILFYGTELVYLKIFQVPLLWGVAKGGAEDVTAYWKEAIIAIGKNIVPLILLILPLFIVAILFAKRIIVMKRRKLKLQVIIALFAVFFILLPIGMLRIQDTDSIVYEAYYQLNDYKVAAKNLGISTTFRRDIQGIAMSANGLDNLISSNPGNVQDTQQSPSIPGQEEVTNETQVDRTPNVLDIDFDQLIATAPNDTIKKLDEYFQSATPSNKNEYTGMFKGKNLIFLTAEGFSPWAINEQITPTLYKLTHEGFVFENFYTPLWVTSTSDGEYTATQGLLPDGSHSFKRAGKNYLPFTMGNQFAKQGVTSLAYHDNSLSYYDRYITHTNMGYTFKAAKLGSLSESKWGDHIFNMEGANEWPASDYNMMVATLPEYIEQKPFNVYYMTVSGHQYYTFDGNRQAAKNKDAVKDLPYTEEGKAYIACNMELDKALQYLIENLEAAGQLENTVIALSADHYPYGLTIDQISDLAGHQVDETFELYKNNFILWTPTIKEPIVIEKPASSVDILPTLNNLFGFDYDSRLLAGRDILSDSEPLVMFKNKSFITDKVMYDNATKKITYLVDEAEVTAEYIEKCKQEVNNRFALSSGILNNDYYEMIK